MSNDPDQEQQIARAILYYLRDHPDAKDSIEGIAQWWLLKRWTEVRLVEVERAVAVLLSDELIVETRREGAPPYYKLNRIKTKEISRILESK